MNYEIEKQEYIKLKKEEWDYIDRLVRKCCNRVLSEEEKLEAYRSLKRIESRLHEIVKTFYEKACEDENLKFDEIYLTI